MTTEILLRDASVAVGPTQFGSELFIRSARVGQLIYEATECGAGPSRSVPGVTGDQMAAVMAVVNAPTQPSG